MERVSIKQLAVNGVLWSVIDLFAGQGVTFIIGIILARLLSPSDYGLIGMLAIFMAIAQTFISSGFSAALIQKTDRTETDYSTVFYFNFGVGILFYVLLYAASPWIARFYNAPSLLLINRVIALNFVIGALSFVHRTKLTIELDFKTQTKVNLLAVTISGCAGIAAAVQGYGVWSLVFQSIINAACQSLFYWIFVRWRPLAVFSTTSFRQLFGYGSKILASGLLDTIYSNMYSLVIGRVFLVSDVGYYTRGQQLAAIPSGSITGVLGRVAFPIFCTLQNEKTQLIAAYRKVIRITSFLTIPLMLLLVSIGRPLVVFLFTDKWMQSVGYFQILCIAGIWYPFHVLNLNILQAIGRSDLFLRLEVLKKISGGAILAATIPFGITMIVAGQAIFSTLCLFINAYYTQKYFDYGILKQLNDVVVFLCIAVVLCGINTYLLDLFELNVIKVIAGTVMFTSLYILVSALLKIEELTEVFSMARTFSVRTMLRFQF